MSHLDDLFHSTFWGRYQDYIKQAANTNIDKEILVDQDGDSLLHNVSAYKGSEYYKFAAEFINSGQFSIKDHNYLGHTPMHICCVNNNPFFINIALSVIKRDFYSEYVDTFSKDYQNTPMHVASMNNSYECVLALCMHGANFECSNHDDQTPETIAKPHTKVKSYLKLISQLFQYSSQTTEEWEQIGKDAFESILEQHLYKPSELLGFCFVRNRNNLTLLQILAKKNRFIQLEMLCDYLYSTEGQVFEVSKYMKDQRYFNSVIEIIDKYLCKILVAKNEKNVFLKYESFTNLIDELLSFNEKKWLYFDFDDEAKTNGTHVIIDPFVQIMHDLLQLVTCDDLNNLIISGWEGESNYQNVNYYFGHITKIVDFIRRKLLVGKMFLLIKLKSYKNFEQFLEANSGLIFAKTRDNETLLHCAAELSADRFMQTILDVTSRTEELTIKKRELINQQLNSTKNSALHLAASKKNIVIVRQLLGHGAYFNIKNKDGFEAFSLCSNHKQILKLLDKVSYYWQEAESSKGRYNIIKKMLKLTPTWLQSLKKLVFEDLAYDESLAILMSKNIKSNKSIIEINLPWQDLLVDLVKVCKHKKHETKYYIDHNKKLEELERAHRQKKKQLYEEAIQAYKNIDCIESQFELAKSYKALADISISEIEYQSNVIENDNSKLVNLLKKSRDLFYQVLDRLRSLEMNKDHPLKSIICSYIAPVEYELKRINSDTIHSTQRHFSEFSDSDRDAVADLLAHDKYDPTAATSISGRLYSNANAPRVYSRSEARSSYEQFDVQSHRLVDIISSLKKQNREEYTALMSKLEELIKINAEKEIQKSRSVLPRGEQAYGNTPIPTMSQRTDTTFNILSEARRRLRMPLCSTAEMQQVLVVDRTTSAATMSGLKDTLMSTITPPTATQRNLLYQTPPVIMSDTASTTAPETQLSLDSILDFAPITHAVDEVPVTMSENNEEDWEELYCARVKLFHFDNKEWKERGSGIMKLLKNMDGEIRLLMRREQVHKICANHLLSKDTELVSVPENDKAYFWIAKDFTDDVLREETFYARFEKSDEAIQFKQKFNDAKIQAKGSVPVESVSFAMVSKSVGESDVNSDYIFGRGEPVLRGNSNPPAIPISGATKPPTGNIFGGAAATPAGCANISSFDLQTDGSVFGAQANTHKHRYEPIISQRVTFLKRDLKSAWNEHELGDLSLLQHSQHDSYRLSFRSEQGNVMCDMALSSNRQFEQLNKSKKTLVWRDPNPVGVQKECLAYFADVEAAKEFKRAIDKAQKLLFERIET